MEQEIKDLEQEYKIILESNSYKENKEAVKKRKRYDLLQSKLWQQCKDCLKTKTITCQFH